MDIMGISAPSTAVTQPFALQNLNFTAPSALRVSDANGYYPFADIVWRGAAIGDRRAQIAAMFTEAADRVASDQTSGVPVTVEVELVRFHGVTERTRYSVGGNYNIVFMMTMRDAETGGIVAAPHKVVGNLSAPGRSAAVAADQAGQTEKFRVTDYLTLILADEMSGKTLS